MGEPSRKVHLLTGKFEKFHYPVANMYKNQTGVLLVFVLALTGSVGFGEETVDLQAVTKIKQEAFEHSKVMEFASQMTDVFGPRLTGSPNLRNAAEWARDEFSSWGLQNSRLESWGEFGRGWVLEDFSLELKVPYYQPLIGFPEAWTRSTQGVLSGTPVAVEISSEKDFEKYRGKLKGSIIVMGESRDVEARFEADARRFAQEELERLTQAPVGRRDAAFEERIRQFRARRELNRKINGFLAEEGVAAVLKASRGSDGTLFVGSGGSYKKDEELGVPSVVLAAEHYGKLLRLLDKKIEVEVELQLASRVLEDDLKGYNVVAELPGTDPRLKDELVMLGAHFDSWHAGTGATDNAAGSAVVMEVMRILVDAGLQPRRTVRVALWSGEEQGLLGSRGYVKEHFGDPKTKERKPAHDRFSGYFNLDNGTGKIRGVYLQSNDAVRPVFEAFLEPLRDLGASILSIRNTGGTDHLAFDAIGLPGFQFVQDPIAYSTRTHHTNMDVYDHLQADDLKQAAAVMATFVYHTAMREEKLPRKPPAKKEESAEATN